MLEVQCAFQLLGVDVTCCNGLQVNLPRTPEDPPEPDWTSCCSVLIKVNVTVHSGAPCFFQTKIKV